MTRQVLFHHFQTRFDQDAVLRMESCAQRSGLVLPGLACKVGSKVFSIRLICTNQRPWARIPGLKGTTDACLSNWGYPVSANSPKSNNLVNPTTNHRCYTPSVTLQEDKKYVGL